MPRAEADNDHRGRDRGRKLEGEREREWNELVAIYPPARITVSAFSVDIIATQLDYNSPPPFPLRSLTAASSTIPYIRGTTMPQTAAAENFAIDIPSLQAWTLGRFLIRARFRESRYRCTPNGRTVYTVYIYIYMCVCIYTWKYRVTEASIGGAKGWKRKKGNAKELELERAGLGERERKGNGGQLPLVHRTAATCFYCEEDVARSRRLTRVVLFPVIIVKILSRP